MLNRLSKMFVWHDTWDWHMSRRYIMHVLTQCSGTVAARPSNAMFPRQLWLDNGINSYIVDIIILRLWQFSFCHMQL